VNWLRIAAICAVLATVGGLVTISNPAAAATPGFYLDLGASVSLGLQPTTADPHGAPTDAGYADDLTEDQSAAGNDLRLVHLGCPGETTATMISGGDRCYRAPDTQLAEAVDFLRGHTDDHGLITLDIGFDDVVACFAHHTLSSACVANGLDLIARQLPTIIDSLRDAAGPEVRMIGVGAYDPFVTDALKGATDQAFAASSIGAIARLNAALLDAYNDVGVPMADVAGPFAGPIVGSTPDALTAMAEHTCSLTWMCAGFPFGPNLHPNDEGYQLMADAIGDKLDH
jgi:lysophospholipase L1-like esterase